MNKKYLRLAAACACLSLMPAAAFANPVTDADDPAYVERTAQPDAAKAKAEAPTIGQLAPLVNEKLMPADKKATKDAVGLYRYLDAVGKSGYVIYGHENDAHHKMFRPEGGSESDTKDVTGSLAGMTGFDALSFTGDELRLTDVEANMGVTCVDRMVDITTKAAKEGSILTLSMHMPNFDLVAKKAKVTGKVDYSGYSPNIMEGNVAHRILPGGDLNTIFNGYLDMVADYGLRMQKQGIPVIFRPLHEHNGYWFWWGAKNTSAQDFQKLWEYTVTYLRDKKGVHNFLYAYSPNGPFTSEEDYLTRYPGDAWVDIMGIDTYDDNQTGEYFTNLDTSLGIMQQAAAKHGKIIALTEAGVRQGGSLAVSGNTDKKWFSEVAAVAEKHHVPYFMTWANFEKLPHNFFAPYMVSKTRGHEMINDFVNFYNEKGTLFADGIADYRAFGK
ncbi:glycoside hydrolase family 26 protein [Mitsuokella sp. WILCCON 0060]|uniref:glycoside hydrolase family 26 protein n=1 Tax=unclassified Mitsuokella TaxID=2637239 RepID=UPI003F0EE887